MNRALIPLVIVAVLAVYGCGGGSGGTGGNTAPKINSMNPANAAIWPSGATNVTCNATDGDNDALTYTWSAPNGGTITGTGATVTFNAPANPVQQQHTVQCTVNDGNGGSDTDTTQIAVGATVTGTAVEMTTQTPVPGVQMEVDGKLGTTDGSGDFTITGVRQGTHQVMTGPQSAYSVAGLVQVQVTTPGSMVPIAQDVQVFTGPPPPPF